MSRLNAVRRKVVVFDRPGKYQFVPGDYPWLTHVLVHLRSGAPGSPETPGSDGAIVLELWGWEEDGSEIIE